LLCHLLCDNNKKERSQQQKQQGMTCDVVVVVVLRWQKKDKEISRTDPTMPSSVFMLFAMLFFPFFSDKIFFYASS